jgi:predicted pyridoxine 5'-phosphate oxidase superfamily flavin-nucleotide-binding protein
VIDAAGTELFESGSALIVATVDAENRPEAARAWGVQVLDGGTRLRVILGTDAERTLANLGATGRVAVTATNVTNHESLQAKGIGTNDGCETAADQARRQSFTTEFFRLVSETDGVPVELLERLLPDAYVTFEMTVEEVFDQTPGPVAGRQVAPEPS